MRFAPTVPTAACRAFCLALTVLAQACSAPMAAPDSGLLDSGVADAGAGDGGSPDGGHSNVNRCGLGAIELPNTGEPCTAAPSCPAARAMNATALMSVSTCTMAKGEAPCTPILVPECPRAAAVNQQFSVVNANKPGGCFSDVALTVTPSANGGATVEWSATEKDPDTCMPVGGPLSGSTVVSGPCCAVHTDVHYPVSDFTFRIEVRTDWQ